MMMMMMMMMMMSGVCPLPYKTLRQAPLNTRACGWRRSCMADIVVPPEMDSWSLT